MPLAIIGFIFLIGIFVYYLISTSSGKTNAKTPDKEEVVNSMRKDKDNIILFPTDVEKAKKKRNIGK
ncbi:MAG: hypothetical protein JJE03_02190 [Peptostreptococcaceae bacterium]|nr:hypothetical protein [Peptostreptococcaceae bacterium]